MRTFILITVLSSLVFSASKATKPYTFTPHTTSSAIQVNSDFDSLYVPFNKAIDTLNKVIPRWSTMLYQKDSTWRYMKIDTIRGNPHIDSIAGRVVMDTITDLDTIYSDAGKIGSVTFLKSGNVGIGITDPSANVHVHEWAVGENNLLRLHSSTGQDAAAVGDGPTIEMSSYNSGFYPIKLKSLATVGATSYPNNKFVIGVNHNGTPADAMTILSSGYVGIGTMAPSCPLTVSGTANASNLLTNYIQFGTTANSKCSTYTDTSWACTSYSEGSLVSTGTAKAIVIGNLIIITLPTLSGSYGSFPTVNIPNFLLPITNTTCTIPASFECNGSQIAGFIRIVQNEKKFQFLKYDGNSCTGTSLGGNLMQFYYYKY